MSTNSTHTPNTPNSPNSPNAPHTPDASSVPSRTKGVMSLARAEMTMLLRNRTAIFNTILIPLLLVAAMYMIARNNGTDAPANMLVVTSVLLAMTYIVYYNLVTTYVARRESYVLKRMRTGTVSDNGILFATALPSVALGALQIVVVVIGAVIVGPPDLSNAIALVIGLVLGFAVFMGLAAASTPFTKTAETAQITTMPVLIISMGLSGMFWPLSVLPGTFESIARATPGAAVVDLLNIGLGGTGRDGEQLTTFAASMGEMVAPTAVLLAWLFVGVYVVRTSFQWEPRR